MLVVIDNYDSFTYNLVQYFQVLGEQPVVFRNDQISLQELIEHDPSAIVISPGPCTPASSGISLAVIDYFAGKVPILGVCLGHQAIAQCFAAKVVRADRVVHGKTSLLHHAGQGLFQGLPKSFIVARYHSLLVDEDSLPAELLITAWCEDPTGGQRLVMALQHREHALYGIQYHPEAILSEYGHTVLKRFLMSCRVGQMKKLTVGC